LIQTWPGLRRKRRALSIRVSHDVDCPSHYAFSPTRACFRLAAGDFLKRGAPLSALKAPWIRRQSRNRLHPKDPANTFEWIMDQSASQGLTSAFYFICGRTHPARDADYEIEHPAIRRLLKEIHQRGHEIGLHPSY